MPFTIIPPDENLPRFAARKVSGEGGRDFSDTIVVFPTVRLGQHFRKELVDLAGACLAPRVMTLNGLIDDLIPLPQQRPVSAIERLFILRSLLKEGEFRHLGPGMEGLISDFFRELAEAGIVPDEESTISRLETAFRDNPFGSEEYAGYWLTMIGELSVLVSAYRVRLDEMGLGEPGWFLARSSRGEYEIPEKRILVCGFYDATPVQINYLRAVAPRAEFIYQAEKSPAFGPVLDFASRIGHDLRPALKSGLPGELTCLDADRIAPLPEKDLSKFSIHVLPSIAAEARQAKFECLKALAAGRSVMVVVPRKGEYVNVFSAVFAAPLSENENSLDLSNALARKCFDDPAVQLLQALLQLGSTDFSSFALADFLLVPGASLLVEENPDSASRITHRLRAFLSEEYLGTYRQLIDAGKRWLRFRNEDGDGTIDFLKRLRSLLAPFLGMKPAEFGRLAVKTLELFERCCRIFPAGDLEEAARARLRSALGDLAGAERHLRLSGPAAEFLTVIKRYMFAADVYTTPQPLAGVQLVHILEARAVPADVLVIAGMNEGDFPAALPPRLIEDPLIRQKMGLITADHLEALEELNFFSLVLQAGKVVLTRCPQASREDEAESRFVTRLRLAGCRPGPSPAVGSSGDNLLRSYRLGKRSKKTARLEERAARRKASGFFPAILPPEVTMSSRGCETFLNCPARFYLELCGIEEAPAAIESPDPLHEGTILHEVAAAAWETCVSEGGEWNRPRLEAFLRELGEEKIPKMAAFTYLRLMMKCGGWHRFSRWLEEMLSVWRPRRWEEKFRMRLKCGSRTFNLSGRADFIGKGKGENVIVVDLKRKKFPSFGEVTNFIKPQLPFYSLGLKAEKTAVSFLGYCSFLMRDKGFFMMEENGLGDELVDRLKQQAEAIDKDGGFICRGEGRNCRYCPYGGVCRVEEMEI